MENNLEMWFTGYKHECSKLSYEVTETIKVRMMVKDDLENGEKCLDSVYI